MILKDLFVQYLNEVSELRNQELDTNNVQFHNKNELRIKMPQSWSVRQSLFDAFEDQDASRKVFVFYSDTASYRTFDNECQSRSIDTPHYCSYFELQCAIMNAPHDIRPQQRITQETQEADVVVVLDVSRCADIALNAIRQFTNGSLILID